MPMMSGSWRLLFRRSRTFCTFVKLFSEEFRVVFNSKKTMCRRICSNGDPPAHIASLNGSPLTWTWRIKHLGNIITCDLKDSEDFTFKKVPLYHRSTGLTAKCLKYLTMLSASCANILLFVVWHVPYKTHTNLLPLLVKRKPFMTQHFSHMSKFYNLLFAQMIHL